MSEEEKAKKEETHVVKKIQNEVHAEVRSPDCACILEQGEGAVYENSINQYPNNHIQVLSRQQLSDLSISGRSVKFQVDETVVILVSEAEFRGFRNV